MQKRILSSNEAREKLVRGIDQLANTIKATLGPKGRNVVIANEYTGPYITNDGATIAREFILEDAFENVGIELVKEVALKTNDLAGDGTTTATLLAQKMIHEGITYIDKGYSPILIKEGIKKAVDLAVEYLMRSSIEVSTSSKINDIAYISSGEMEIGKIIAQAFESNGKDALISIEESRSTKTGLEIVNGYKIEEGYISPYMLSDKEKMVTDFKDPYFLITNQGITDINQISSLLESMMEIGGNLVLISDTISEEVLSVLVLNKLQNNLNIIAIKAPSTHEKRKEILDDIAVVTGGKVISSELGIPLESVSIEDLGRASQVQVYKNETIIFDGWADAQQLHQKQKQVRYLLDECALDFEKNSLRERLAKLSQSAAVIKVGALSELEMKEKKMKIEDALCATRVAVKEGILPGGGIAYINTAKHLQSISKSLQNEEKIGFDITIASLKEPIHQLLLNAGVSNKEEIIDKIETEASSIGYNIRNSQFVDMIETGIIDPVTVERVALQSASSIAALILTTESVLVDVTTESIIKKDLNDQLLHDSSAGLF
ncbi:MAG: chaperonin GroEL [Coprobacillaceae bacterium]